MGFCYYREWKVEQDMNNLEVNIEGIDMKYILQPDIPTSADFPKSYQFKHVMINGKKAVVAPSQPFDTVEDGFDIRNIDYTLAKSKGLADASNKPNQAYLKLEAVYRATFNAYVNAHGALSTIDQAIRESANGYPQIPAKYKHVYQKYGSFGRSYVYLENDFYIEKLSEGDLELLKDPTQDNLQDIMDMVARTYRDVVTIPTSNPAGLTTGYGISPEYATANGTVVLALGYDYDLKQWSENDYDSALTWIQQQADSLQSELSQQLGCTVAVFVNEGIGQVQ
jgi:hypothetical protein